MKPTLSVAIIKNRDVELKEKSLIVVAVEIKDGQMGRIRLKRISDASSDSLHGFAVGSIERDSTLHTDGWKG